jgi:GNAT superfamily N-acetyltransferase
MQLEIRPGTDGDTALILDSFINTYHLAPQAGGASKATLASLIEPLIHSERWRVAVACIPDDPDTILGFIVYDSRAIDPSVATVGWVQVKAPWRRKGVAKALLAHAGVQLDGTCREVRTPFLVQRITSDRNAPVLTDLLRARGCTARFRPYLPLEEQRLQALAFLSA